MIVVTMRMITDTTDGRDVCLPPPGIIGIIGMLIEGVEVNMIEVIGIIGMGVAVVIVMVGIRIIMIRDSEGTRHSHSRITLVVVAG